MIANLLISIFSFILILGLIVFIHEAGHFYAARFNKIKIDVFSIGFGPVLFSRIDKYKTKWQISAIPLGGYVKFFGDKNPTSTGFSKSQTNMTDETSISNQSNKEEKLPLTEEEKKVCFHFKPLLVRAFVVLAGPLANFILAWVILTAMLLFVGKASFKPIVGDVTKNGAAYEAGLISGDKIIKVNNKKIKDWNDLTMSVVTKAGQDLAFTVERAGSKTLNLIVTPRLIERKDSFGNALKVGTIGISTRKDAYFFLKPSIIQAPIMAGADVWSIISGSLGFIKSIAIGALPFDQLGGPVKIAKVAGQAAGAGFNSNIKTSIFKKILLSFLSIMQLAAVISVSIGFLNLLPIPALDGGHLFFYLIEAIARKPIPEKIQQYGLVLGMTLLLALMIMVTYTDISGLIKSIAWN